jgi:tripartite-type tricarboxylate transporter receptor subunit TctC
VLRLIRLGFSSLLMLGLAAASAAAEDFPTRTVRIIVPFAAGGPNDAAARLVAEALRPQLGQPVVVENRAGAGGVAGAEAVATAAPDGYTLLLGTAGPLVVSPSAKVLRYSVTKDFAPIGQIYRSAQVFAATPKLGVKTVSELVAYARANPGKVNIGSAGIGTLPHLSIEMLKREASVNVAHVPYRGTSAALTDLLGGQIEALFGDIALVAPNIHSGKLVALAVTSPDRPRLLPEASTMTQSGFPALETESWGGLLAPSGVPRQVLRRLEEALQKALADPAFREAADKQGWSDLTTSRDSFAALIERETAKWAPLVKAQGLAIN